MDKLNGDQKQEILQFCRRNEDFDFHYIAKRFSERFGIELTHEDVYQLYMGSLMGRVS